MNELYKTLSLILSDGCPHSVADLCQQLNTDIGGLNRIRNKLPEYINHLLKQSDSQWQLRQPIVYFTEHQFADLAESQNLNIRILESCPSTNSFLLDEIRKNQDSGDSCVLICHQQTSGRGRLARKWDSEGGQALTFSLSWATALPQMQLSALPLLVALSCQQVLQELNISIQIKWPNDLIYENKKIGGILIESLPKGFGSCCVIGIGLNFHQPSLHQASYLWSENTQLSPLKLLKSLILKIYQNLKIFTNNGFSVFQAAYTAVHREHGQIVRLLHHDTVLAEGKVSGIDADGALLLNLNDEIKRFVSGDISLRYLPNLEKNASSSPILLLDCGNSQVKWALAINGEIIETFRTPYTRLNHLMDYCLKHPDITKIYGSAVCGEPKKKQVGRNLPKPVAWLASERFSCGVHNHYRHPSEHGSDRWFNALGAIKISENSCVIVSCGTAITIDALTDTKQYLGGSIMPGFNLMKEAMADKTANLDRPFGRAYPFATTTPNALASGILDASIGAILLMHKRLKEKNENKPVDLILTGGGAIRIYRHLPPQFLLDTHVEIVDNLVIFGLLNWIAHK